MSSATHLKKSFRIIEKARPTDDVDKVCDYIRWRLGRLTFLIDLHYDQRGAW